MGIRFSELKEKLQQETLGLATKDSVYNWVRENVVIKSKIPLTEKYAAISMVSNELNRVISEQEELDGYIYMRYDIISLFEILFKYTDIYVLDKYRTSENYDIIINSSFYNAVMEKCGLDYRDCISKCDRVVGIDSVSLAKMIADTFSKAPSVEQMEKIRDIINNEIDPEKMKIMENIQAYNNPALKKIIDFNSIKKKD